MSVGQRIFGRTGLKVSEIGFGCGPGAKLMVGEDHQARLACVARALDLGVTYFDTAAAYGAGRSESNLGRTLDDLGRPAVVLATKVTLEWDDLADIPAAVERSITGSLDRLGAERLDIVHLHNRVGAEPNARSPFGSGAQLSLTQILGPAADALAREKARGRIAHFGCCAFGGDTDLVARMVASDRFDSVLVNYSLLNPSAFAGEARADDLDYQGIGAQAAAQDMAVVDLRVLEAGKLAGAPSGPTTGLDFLLDDSRDLAEAAIRFSLSNPAVSTVLVGFSDLAQVEAAAAAAAKGSLSPADLARIETWRAGS